MDIFGIIFWPQRVYKRECQGKFSMYADYQGGISMNRKKMLMTTVALGAAYLMRNKESREKIMNQMQSLGAPKKKNKVEME